MLLYPYAELLRHARKGQNMGINTVMTIVLILAGVFIFVAVLYYLMNNGKIALGEINPLDYQ
ncbi:MAG: hypothetical protein KAS11_04955 [Candidatus Aenigmarchaeota archaeon]|nr:hypothetical protein [Candidatus Aenigmarchaeota archaeon]MCK5234518.1 hypothetical protein [Candidatus Aenigmarchaeota archaeon]